MSDSSDDMEFYSGLIDNEDLDYTDQELQVLEYCRPHTDQMWAATIVAIILQCDFRDAKEKLKNF